jgi:predicted RNA-binding Zn ribbon-like protein
MSTGSRGPRLGEPLPIALANTIWTDRGGVHDDLSDVADVQRWVRAVGEQVNLLPAQQKGDIVTPDAAHRLVDLRDAVRRLAAEHSHDSRSLGQSPISDAAAAISVVNRISATSSVWPELVPQASTPERRHLWAGGSFFDALIAVIAQETVDLIVSPQWLQLRPCLAPGCAYFFVKDHFRREWCSAVCGNRARVARHAQRRA